MNNQRITYIDSILFLVEKKQCNRYKKESEFFRIHRETIIDMAMVPYLTFCQVEKN